jgi:hypothetical protein
MLAQQMEYDRQQSGGGSGVLGLQVGLFPSHVEVKSLP